MNRYLKPITLADIRWLLMPNEKNKFCYLGQCYIQEPESRVGIILTNLFTEIDNNLRPKWCPRILLRFLHIFGDDRSTVRIRNMKLSLIKSRILRRTRITNIKYKFGKLNIYGIFPDNAIKVLVDEYIEKLNNVNKNYSIDNEQVSKF